MTSTSRHVPSTPSGQFSDSSGAKKKWPSSFNKNKKHNKRAVDKTPNGVHLNKESLLAKMRRNVRADYVQMDDFPSNHGVVEIMEEPIIQESHLPSFQQNNTAMTAGNSSKQGLVERKSASASTEKAQESCTEEPSAEFNASDSFFLQVSVDTEEGETFHPFDEFELSVSSEEPQEDDIVHEKNADDSGSGKCHTNHQCENFNLRVNKFLIAIAVSCYSDCESTTHTDADEGKDIKPTITLETFYSNGDSESTESTTSLSSVESPSNTGAANTKTASLSAKTVTSFSTPKQCAELTGTNTRISHNRQASCPQSSYQPARFRRPADTPSSFRSERFQEYLFFFHDQDPEQSLETPPPAENADDQFESVLDRPFRYWNALDEVLEYSYPEWLTHQRGRMIHHLIHFLELKVGFQDYSVDKSPSCADGQSNQSKHPAISSGGGRLVPSLVVDEAWRALVLESTLYEKITRHLQEFHGQQSYQYIHYSRVKTVMKSCRIRGISEELATTQYLFQTYFREFMPASIRQVRTTTPPSLCQVSFTTSPASSPQASEKSSQVKHGNRKDFHTMNSSLSEGNLRGLACLTPTPKAAKKPVVWC